MEERGACFKDNLTIPHENTNTVDTYLPMMHTEPTLHVVIDSDASMGALDVQLKAQGFTTLLLPESAGLAGLDALLDRTRPQARFQAISLYCHAHAANLDLGDQQINADTVDANAAALKELGTHLAPGGDLMLYGCSLAGSNAGRELVDRIGHLAGVDVAASTDLTGSKGNWELEYQRGSINAMPVDELTGLPWDGALATLQKPVRVQLHWLHEDGSNEKPQKLGLYATLGGGTRPQIFEFDTGGAGFYAAYSPSSSNWWGSDWAATGNDFNQSYGSQLDYQGQAVTTSVSLFADSDSSTPLLTAEDVVVGQSTTISSAKTTPPKPLWPLPSPSSLPPTNGAFYGDFGMALQQGQAGIDSLVAQLDYGPGVMAGFRVHASTKHPWVQFGLRAKDLQDQSMTLTLNRAGSASNTGVPYYEKTVVSGSVHIKKQTSGHKNKDRFSSPIGMIFDTGASTTIHTDSDNSVPSDLTTDTPTERVISKASFRVKAPLANTKPNDSDAKIMGFMTGKTINANLVSIKSGSSYYLNTGITPFLKKDLIFRLDEGLLTLVPRNKS